MTPEEKKAEIIRIALEEFASCGYSGASTNTITKRAGISKGMLFHYFGSKKELFLMILADAAKRMAGGANARAAVPPGASLYDAMAALFMSKAAYYTENPQIMALLERAQLEQSAEVRQDIVATLKQLAVTMLQKRAEFSRSVVEGAKLRAGLTREQALECILLSLEALDAHFYALYRGRGADIIVNPEPMLDKMKLYLSVVSRGLFED